MAAKCATWMHGCGTHRAGGMFDPVVRFTLHMAPIITMRIASFWAGDPKAGNAASCAK
jgi:hypothetical protein